MSSSLLDGVSGQAGSGIAHQLCRARAVYPRHFVAVKKFIHGEAEGKCGKNLHAVHYIAIAESMHTLHITAKIIFCNAL